MSNTKMMVSAPVQIDADKDMHPFKISLDAFLRSMDDYGDAVKIALPAILKERSDALKKSAKKFKEFDKAIKENSSAEEEIKDAHKLKVLIDHIDEFERLTESRLIPLTIRGIFIGVFSEYDSFIGKLLKAVYYKRQDLLKDISREISLKDLMGYSALDEIKKDMLEKEIDSFRRNSYIEQFSDLEKMFGISTLTQFKEWPSFVEMAQRRNVMTHNDGRVSQQYLQVCDREKVSFDTRPIIGSELELTPQYLFNTIHTLSKVGFMLAHTLWRKLLPSNGEIEIANDEANGAIFNLLTAKRWNAAASFGEFSLTQPMLKGINEVSKMIRIVNIAIAYKNLGNKEKAIKVLDSIDWSACIRDFKLANAILRDDYQKSSEIMVSIGKTGEMVNEVAYYHWPLFEEARGRVEFQHAYETVYGHPFKEIVKKEARQRTVTASISELDKIPKAKKSQSNKETKILKTTKKSVTTTKP